MEIFVYSRRALEATQPHEVPHVLISITSHVDDVARLRANSMRLEVLRLSFVDLVSASETIGEGELFSDAQADAIWDLVRRHRDAVTRILVHCDAGVSRSAAVGAAIARVLNGDDAEFFGGRYAPNARVYEMLLARRP